MKASNSVETIIRPGSKSLYFFFGGIQASIAIPPFEFYKASGIIDENKVLLRDFSQSWYHAGLKDISVDINTTANYIENIINQISPEKLFFVGNSMGGYAAILLSALIGKGEVIAFAPQTFISSDLREKYNDTRWPQQIAKTLGLSTTHKEAHDLKEVLSNAKKDNKTSIYVARDNALDLNHASHVKGCPGVKVVEFDAGGHSLVRELRDNGKLPRIMVGEYA
jgi:predicted esterase YcpF (UPF0227 family)